MDRISKGGVTMKFSRIDSFKDPLGMMMDQSHWAFERSIINYESKKGQKFWELHRHFEREIEKYLDECPAF